MQLKSTFILLLTGLFFWACSPDEDQPNADEVALGLGWQYYPVAVGQYVTYKADSIFHDQPDVSIPGVHDTTSYFIKEYIESEFTDAAGEPALRLERYKKTLEQDPWELRDVWFLKRTRRSIEKTEENVRYIKFGIPVSTTTTWDGNAGNELPEWEYSYDSLYVARTYGDLNFSRTVKVLQRDNKNFVEDELAYEIYAENVGLICRYHRDLDTRLDYTNFPTANNIRLGVEFKWEVIDYGVE
jgi:hypothetical protein